MSIETNDGYDESIRDADTLEHERVAHLNLALRHQFLQFLSGQFTRIKIPRHAIYLCVCVCLTLGPFGPFEPFQDREGKMNPSQGQNRWANHMGITLYTFGVPLGTPMENFWTPMTILGPHAKGPIA